jgi:hypothetical protein
MPVSLRLGVSPSPNPQAGGPRPSAVLHIWRLSPISHNPLPVTILPDPLTTVRCLPSVYPNSLPYTSHSLLILADWQTFWCSLWTVTWILTSLTSFPSLSTHVPIIITFCCCQNLSGPLWAPRRLLFCTNSPGRYLKHRNSESET